MLLPPRVSKWYGRSISETRISINEIFPGFYVQRIRFEFFKEPKEIRDRPAPIVIPAADA